MTVEVTGGVTCDCHRGYTPTVTVEVSLPPVTVEVYTTCDCRPLQSPVTVEVTPPVTVEVTPLVTVEVTPPVTVEVTPPVTVEDHRGCHL